MWEGSLTLNSTTTQIVLANLFSFHSFVQQLHYNLSEYFTLLQIKEEEIYYFISNHTTNYNLLERKYEFIFTCEWNFNDRTFFMNNYEWFSIRIDIAHKEFSQVGFYSAKKELRWYPWLALKFLSLENALRSKIMAWVPSMLLSYFLAL